MLPALAPCTVIRCDSVAGSELPSTQTLVLFWFAGPSMITLKLQDSPVSLEVQLQDPETPASSVVAGSVGSPQPQRMLSRGRTKKSGRCNIE